MADDGTGSDCFSCTTTGTTERGAATGLGMTAGTMESGLGTAGTTSTGLMMGGDAAGDGVRLMAANSLAKTAALSNWPAAIASSNRNNINSTFLSSFNSSDDSSH